MKKIHSQNAGTGSWRFYSREGEQQFPFIPVMNTINLGIYKLRSGVRLLCLIYFYVLLEIWTQGLFRIFTLCCLKVQNAGCRFISFYQHIYRFKDAKKTLSNQKKVTKKIDEVPYLTSSKPGFSKSQMWGKILDFINSISHFFGTL